MSYNHRIGGAYRGVDINDVLLNAIGVLVGYGVYRGVERWIHRWIVARKMRSPN